VAGTCCATYPERPELNSDPPMGRAQPGPPQVSLYPQLTLGAHGTNLRPAMLHLVPPFLTWLHVVFRVGNLARDVRSLAPDPQVGGGPHSGREDSMTGRGT
jgi:hypothetical protein